MKNLLLVLAVISCFSASGQVKFVNEFLNIGVGARAHGMFGSVVANVDDGTAGYWNTAGLTAIDDELQINAMHANWFGGIASYDYLSVVKKFKGDNRSVGGLSLIRMGIDNIPNTFNLIGPDGTVNVDRVTNFSASDYAFLLSYARAMDKDNRFSLGGNLKVINRSLGEFGTAWGFGADLSAMYRLEKLSFGVMVRDITTTVNSWSFNLTEEQKEVFQQTNNDIPVSSTEIALPKMIIGAAYKDRIGNVSYLVEVDLNLSTNGTEASVFGGSGFVVDPTFGTEVGYNDKVFVRMGIGNIQSIVNSENTEERVTEFQPNIGLGLNLGRLKVDYALTNIGSFSGVLASHIFSLTLNINPRKSATK